MLAKQFVLLRQREEDREIIFLDIYLNFYELFTNNRTVDTEEAKSETHRRR